MADTLLIGSRAFQPERLEENWKETDHDFIMTWDAFESFRDKGVWLSYKPISDSKWVLVNQDTGYDRQISIYEVEIAWPATSASLLLQYCGSSEVADDNVSLMLKLSHRYLKDSPHFMKTRNDIMLLRERGASLDEELQAILALRETETYWYEHPNLNRDKDEFFVDQYLFDHDSLHEVVAIGDQPAYTQFQKPGAEVMCDMDKFFTLPYHTQLCAVYEEAAVLALERSFIPHGRDQDWAFKKALEKVCTSITSGRFRNFAWENYDAVLELKNGLDKLYTVSFFEGLLDGTVKPMEKIGG